MGSGTAVEQHQNGWWNFRWKLEEASEQDVHLQLPGGGELLPPHDQLPGVQGHGTPWTSLLLRKNSRVSTVWKEHRSDYLQQPHQRDNLQLHHHQVQLVMEGDGLAKYPSGSHSKLDSIWPLTRLLESVTSAHLTSRLSSFRPPLVRI